MEKASTAITQSAWKPRETTSSNYTRAQLDAALEAMMAEKQKATAQRTGVFEPERIFPRFRRLQRVTAGPVGMGERSDTHYAPGW